MTVPTLPVMRVGEVYQSLEVAELLDVRTKGAAGRVMQANAGLIRRDARKAAGARATLRKLTTEERIGMAVRAGEIFMDMEVPLADGQTQEPQEYVAAVSATTGMPHALVKGNMRKIHEVFTKMEDIVRGLTLGMPPEVLDRGVGKVNGVEVSYVARTESLGVVLPSNSPGVNSLWMPAVAMGVPVVIKPGREEPWTAWRVIQSFIAAGVPAEAFSFYPTDHAGSAAVMESCGRSMIFGDQKTVEKYRNNPAVEVHGPGWSKVLIGKDRAGKWREYLDVMVESVTANGGRSCINASAVVTAGHGDEIAEALATRLVKIRPRKADDPEAGLAGFANAAVAEGIDREITEGLKVPGAVDVTAKHHSGGRVVEFEGCMYLLPTVVRCATMGHPLANREFLFPYVSVVEVEEEEMTKAIGPTLVATAVTGDEGLIRRLVDCPLIDRLNIGATPTNRVRWDQPHEGNLFEFLYRRRAIERG